MSGRRGMRAAALACAGLLATGATCTAAPDQSAMEPGAPVDLAAYARIRAEGLGHSHVMAYAQTLADRFGGRLAGSSALTDARAWAAGQLGALGAQHVHTEDIGALAVPWRQTEASLALSAPEPAVLDAQAAPWSPPTSGRLEAPAVLADLKDDADLTRWHGRLRGKVLLLDHIPPLAPSVAPLVQRLGDAEIDSGAATAPIRAMYARHAARAPDFTAKRDAFARRLMDYVAEEGVAAVVVASPGRPNGSGTKLLQVDDSSFGFETWRATSRLKVPVMVTSPESYGRMQRLLDAGEPVRVALRIATEDGGREAQAYNLVAELPGEGSERDQVVLVGAHLDSWAAGTGATDDGAGVAIVLEAARILEAIGAHPRRTLRVVLYDGEEPGLFGSVAYARAHLAEPPSGVAANLPPEQWASRRPLPGLARLAASFNLDDGGGRVRAVFTNGDDAFAPALDRWIAPLADLGVRKVLRERDWPDDLIAFTGLGVPGISFLQDPLDYYTRTHHSDADTADHLSAPDLEQAAVVTATLLYDTLTTPEPIPR